MTGLKFRVRGRELTLSPRPDGAWDVEDLHGCVIGHPIWFRAGKLPMTVVRSAVQKIAEPYYLAIDRKFEAEDRAAMREKREVAQFVGRYGSRPIGTLGALCAL